MPENVSTDEALRKLRRTFAWRALALNVFWLALAYPVVITVRWEDWVFLMLLGRAALGFLYVRKRKRIRVASDAGRTGATGR